MLGFAAAAWKTAPRGAPAQSRARGQQRPLPHPALDTHPQSRLAPARAAPAPPPSRLELLYPLIEFFEERGRAPDEDELPGGDAIRARFGSLRRAFRLVQRAHDADEWKRIVHRPRGRSSHLPRSLEVRRKTPASGSSRSPCVETFARSSRPIVGHARKRTLLCLPLATWSGCRGQRGRSSVGKLTPSAIYVHESALESLHPLLRLYEGCARRYIGRVDGANLIKLHTGEPKISYLSYPHFEPDPPSGTRDVHDGSPPDVPHA